MTEDDVKARFEKKNIRSLPPAQKKRYWHDAEAA